MPKMICKICEKEFWIKPSRIKTGRGKTCSNECSYEYRSLHIPPWNKGLHIQTNTGRTHFKKGDNLGEKHYNWQGGELTHANGYILIYSPQHPLNIKRYVFRSHLVMEKMIGRYLTEKEVIHHINGIVDDDRIENLKLFTNQSEHCKFHDSLRKRNKLGQFGNIFFCVLTGIYSPIS